MPWIESSNLDRKRTDGDIYFKSFLQRFPLSVLRYWIILNAQRFWHCFKILRFKPSKFLSELRTLETFDIFVYGIFTFGKIF